MIVWLLRQCLRPLGWLEGALAGGGMTDVDFDPQTSGWDD